MSVKHSLTISPRVSREFCWNVQPSKIQGAGNAGCALHPRSRAQRSGRLRARAYRAAEAIRHSLRNGSTAYAMLSSALDLDTVADGLKADRNPVGSTHLRQLDTSIGCQDHMVLPYAAAPSS